MARSTTLSVVVVGAALICEALLGAGCGGDAGSPTPDATPGRATSTRPRNQEERRPESTIDLAELLTKVPQYEGRGRNLFIFGRERTVVEARPPVSTPAVTTTVPPAPVNRGPQTPPARIDLKFAGFVEKTESGGSSKKYAVFLDGEEILTGAEGDLVGNRYKIVEIGLESVTVALEGTQMTQQIPLRTN